MDCPSQHLVWLEQVAKLKTSVFDLSHTSPQNVLQHFFLRAVERELENELETDKTMAKALICLASCSTVAGSTRQRSVHILRQLFKAKGLKDIRLVDIRNRAVFEIYKRCGISIDTYFDRYSSPAGSPVQIAAYLSIAHGSSIASALETQNLSRLLLFMQLLKRFFVVLDLVNGLDFQPGPETLNWIGAMWAHTVQEKSLGDLVWKLFLDVWHYENGLPCEGVFNATE